MEPGKPDLQFLTLVIDKEGQWLHEGEVITHERTLTLFQSALDVDDDGRFFIAVGPERAFVEVEDAPFIVEALRLVDSKITLRLNDGTHHTLDPTTLRLTSENVPYCKVRDGKMEAKFSRTAWYQLAEHIEEKGGRFVLMVGDESFDLTIED